MDYMPYRPNPSNPIVFFDISRPNAHVGRVVMELFADTVPRTVENFRSLCTGERGFAQYTQNHSAHCKLYFKGIPFHRIIPDFIVQGGDILHMDGRGNESIFGYTFYDENFSGKAGKNLSGTLAMAHNGPNQNGSQFFFNMGDNSPHLDGKYVVFGQVIDGWKAVQEISKLGGRCGTPREQCWISECGQAGVETLREHADGAAIQHVEGKEVLDMLRPRGAQNLHPWKDSDY